MKRISILIVALCLGFFTSNGQGVLVVSHIESKDFTAFGNTLDHYMSAVKKATETENLGFRVHRVDGSRELIATRWFDSMKEMVNKMDEEESKNEEIGTILQSAPEPVEGSWEKFVASTDFKGSSV